MPCWYLESLYTQENVKSVVIRAAHSSYVHFMFVDMFYLLRTWTLCFSLSSLLYHHHPCGWLSPAKPWWSIETFGMLTPPKGTQNDEWHWSQCDDLLEVLAFFLLFFYFLFFVCSLIDNTSFFLLSTFSQSGFLHALVCLRLTSLCCVCCPFLKLYWVMHKMLSETSSVSMPVWKRLPNQRNKWTECLDMHH